MMNASNLEIPLKKGDFEGWVPSLKRRGREDQRASKHTLGDMQVVLDILGLFVLLDIGLTH
jgi:hypothetical protein